MKKNIFPDVSIPRAAAAALPEPVEIVVCV